MPQTLKEIQDELRDLLMGAEPLTVCKALCAVAEKADPSTDPWPKDGEGEPAEYVPSAVGEAIGLALIANVARVDHLAPYRIHYLYRNKAKWESAGLTIYGQMKRPSGLLKKYSDADFIVLLNWPIWQGMTPMQRVALVYHELRHGDGEGKIRGHDFEGFFDELALFGVDTYRDWAKLAEAARKGSGVRHQYSLDLGAFDRTSPEADEETAGSDPFGADAKAEPVGAAN